MEDQTSTKINSNWMPHLNWKQVTIIVFGFLFLTVCIERAAYVARRFLELAAEEERRSLQDPRQPEVGVSDRGKAPAAAVPRMDSVPDEKATPKEVDSLQKDQSVVSTVDHNSTEADPGEVARDSIVMLWAIRLRSAKPEERAQLLRDITAKTEENFEFRQLKWKQELDRLSSQIDALRDKQMQRQKNKAKIIQRRLAFLTDPDSDLSWEETGSGPTKPELPDRKNSSEPTYEGLTLSEGLKILETERSSTKLYQAILAVQVLAQDADPRRLVRAVFHMAQNMAGGGIVEIDFTGTQVALLLAVPSEIVMERLIEELKLVIGRKPSAAFKKIVTTWIGSASRFPGPKTIYFDPIDDVTESDANRQSGGTTEESGKSVRDQVRQHSGALVRALVKIAERDASQGDWVLETLQYVLDLSDLRLTDSPDLVPIAQRVLAKTMAINARTTALCLLAQSGLHRPEFLEYLTSTLKRDVPVATHITIEGDVKHAPYVTACNWSIRLADEIPQVVTIVTEELKQRWSKLDPSRPPVNAEQDGTDPTIAPRRPDEPALADFNVSFLYLIETLGEIGTPARDALPLLQAIEQSALSKADLKDFIFQGVVAGTIINGKRFQPREKLGDHVNVAIQKIEQAISNPTVKATVRTTREEPKEDAQRMPAATPLPNVVPAADFVNSKQLTDKTFDGIPYREWLKLLETEVKPEKLASAVEACSRLAEPQDQRRIARNIVLAARLFEEGDHEGQKRVWFACDSGLIRLPGDVVVDELIAALADPNSYKQGRKFQAEFLIRVSAKKIVETVTNRADEMIAALMNTISIEAQDADYLSCAASRIAGLSQKPLSEYENLQRQLMKFVEAGPDTGRQTVNAKSQLVSVWTLTATHLVDKAPETPGLASALMKHARKNVQTIEMLGNLGKYGAEAVPFLVDQFLEQWKLTEPQGSWPQNFNRAGPEALEIVRTIGKIGVGDKGRELLRELCLIVPPSLETGTIAGKIFFTANWGLKRFAPQETLGSDNLLFDDKTLITGRWKIKDTERPEGSKTRFLRLNDSKFFKLMRIDDGPLSYTGNIGDFDLLSNYDIDEEKFPKQISLTEKGTLKRQFGIYELGETSLRIQIAKVGEPRPSEFATEKSKVPTSQLLLELERDSTSDENDTAHEK